MKLNTIIGNAVKLLSYSTGSAEEQSFFRTRVRNALHHVAIDLDGSTVFAPVKWSAINKPTLSNYLEKKDPQTSTFIQSVNKAGFTAVYEGAKHAALLSKFERFCASFGFTPSAGDNPRVFYILETAEYLPEEERADGNFMEGAVTTVLVNRFERNKEARQRCIDAFGVSCIVCEFDFQQRYGGRGKGFIHVHHLLPLSLISAEYVVDPESDLRPVCPNCHAMLHRGELITPDELKLLLNP